MYRPYVAVAAGNVLGETPAWSVRTQSLYWVDIRAPALHCLHHESGAHVTWPMPDLCCAVVPATDGVIVAFRTFVAHFDATTARLTPIVDVEPSEYGNRLNEAKCDRAGRLWIAAGTELLGPDDAPGVPDGCAVDSEGFLWNARFRAGLIVRVSPRGQIVEQLALPVTQPTSCTFGGADLRTLFVTTARQRLSDSELAAQESAGHLFAVQVDTPGLPDSEFRFM